MYLKIILKTAIFSFLLVGSCFGFSDIEKESCNLKKPSSTESWLKSQENKIPSTLKKLLDVKIEKAFITVSTALLDLQKIKANKTDTSDLKDLRIKFHRSVFNNTGFNDFMELLAVNYTKSDTSLNDDLSALHSYLPKRVSPVDVYLVKSLLDRYNGKFDKNLKNRFLKKIKDISSPSKYGNESFNDFLAAKEALIDDLSNNTKELVKIFKHNCEKLSAAALINGDSSCYDRNTIKLSLSSKNEDNLKSMDELSNILDDSKAEFLLGPSKSDKEDTPRKGYVELNVTRKGTTSSYGFTAKVIMFDGDKAPAGVFSWETVCPRNANSKCSEPYPPSHSTDGSISGTFEVSENDIGFMVEFYPSDGVTIVKHGKAELIPTTRLPDSKRYGKVIVEKINDRGYQAKVVMRDKLPPPKGELWMYLKCLKPSGNLGKCDKFYIGDYDGESDATFGFQIPDANTNYSRLIFQIFLEGEIEEDNITHATIILGETDNDDNPTGKIEVELSVANDSTDDTIILKARAKADSKQEKVSGSFKWTCFDEDSEEIDCDANISEDKDEYPLSRFKMDFPKNDMTIFVTYELYEWLEDEFIVIPEEMKFSVTGTGKDPKDSVLSISKEELKVDMKEMVLLGDVNPSIKGEYNWECIRYSNGDAKFCEHEGRTHTFKMYKDKSYKVELIFKSGGTELSKFAVIPKQCKTKESCEEANNDETDNKPDSKWGSIHDICPGNPFCDHDLINPPVPIQYPADGAYLLPGVY